MGWRRFRKLGDFSVVPPSHRTSSPSRVVRTTDRANLREMLRFDGVTMDVERSQRTNDTRRRESASPRVAYFSMEIAIREDIPTYSGGLGVLAGDALRAAADLGVPMVGVTLVHRKGSPNAYAQVMRSPIAVNGSFFNAQRMLAQYAANAYRLSTGGSDW